jgi:hypothetical protein
MKSDVKAIRKTDATSVFAGRTRLRGIILGASTGSAEFSNFTRTVIRVHTYFSSGCSSWRRVFI